MVCGLANVRMAGDRLGGVVTPTGLNNVFGVCEGGGGFRDGLSNDL